MMAPDSAETEDNMAKKRARPAGDAGYAIVDAHGVIVSLHTRWVSAGAGWGFDRELVELRYPHRVGDTVEYDRHGRESYHAR